MDKNLSKVFVGAHCKKHSARGENWGHDLFRELSELEVATKVLIVQPGAFGFQAIQEHSPTKQEGFSLTSALGNLFFTGMLGILILFVKSRIARFF